MSSTMDAAGQQTPSRAKQVDISESEAIAERLRMDQNNINDGTFASLQAQYEEARRTGDYLEQALQAARLREQILGGAMDRLNAPQQASPSLR